MKAETLGQEGDELIKLLDLKITKESFVEIETEHFRGQREEFVAIIKKLKE